MRFDLVLFYKTNTINIQGSTIFHLRKWPWLLAQ